MATQKQIDANRRNALRSTGPKSAQGKMLSSRNGTVHGLRSKDPVLPAIESFEEWEIHLRTFVESVRAEGSLELLLAHKAASALWKQARTEGFQNDLAAAQMEEGIAQFEAECPLPAVDPDECPDLNARLWKYENEFAHVPEVHALFHHAFRSAMPKDRQADLLLRYYKAFENEFFRSYNLLVKIRDARESAQGMARNSFLDDRRRARVDQIKANLTAGQVDRLLQSSKLDEDTRIAIEEWLAAGCPPAPTAATPDPAPKPAAPVRETQADPKLGSVGSAAQPFVQKTTCSDSVRPAASPAMPAIEPKDPMPGLAQAEVKLGSVGNGMKTDLSANTCDSGIKPAGAIEPNAVPRPKPEPELSVGRSRS